MSRARSLRKTTRPALTRFWFTLLNLSSGASGWLISAFVLGVLALGILANLIYDILVGPEGISLDAALRVIAIAIGLIALAYIAYRIDLNKAWREQRIDTTIDEARLAPAHAGLIWLLSLGSIDSCLIAIRHHLDAAGARLRHCWVLITPGARNVYDQLIQRIDETGVELHPIYLQAATIEATYRAVDRVYTVEAQQAELEPDQIIADLTGGFKTMTAGMVMACLPHRRTLEYIESERDPVSGQPIENTQRAVLVGVDFQIARSDREHNR